MTPPDSATRPLPRRNILTWLASLTGVMGLDALSAAAAAPKPQPAPPPAPKPDTYGLQLTQLRDDTTLRSSSWDHNGANGDAQPIYPGKTLTVLDVTGPGVVTHLWFTLNSSEPYFLKYHVLRAYWDGEETPSIEVPLGDFFGLGLGDYFNYQSALLTVAPNRGMNAYFPMPFRKSARITVTNEGILRTNLFYNIDYALVPALPDDVAYFHAQFRQKTPTKASLESWKTGYEATTLSLKNLDGANNYVYLEATGRGHVVGITHSIIQNQDGWLGEGDDMIFIDGSPLPTINGTGLEDFFCGAYDFGGKNGSIPFSYPLNGAPYIQSAEIAGGRICLYRWLTDNPIRFKKSIKFTVEHGHANIRADNYFTVAYWYQTEPHGIFPVLPPIQARIPRLFHVSGPGITDPTPDIPTPDIPTPDIPAPPPPR